MDSRCNVCSSFREGLECSLCLNINTDPKNRVSTLPCQHALCRQCLSQLAKPPPRVNPQPTACPQCGTESNGQSVEINDLSQAGCSDRVEQYQCPDPEQGPHYSASKEEMSFPLGTNTPIPRRYSPADSLVGPDDIRFSDVAVNRAGEVAALDRLRKSVCIFDGSEQTQLDEDCRQWLVNPSGLAYNKAGKLFVSDEGGLIGRALYQKPSISVFRADISHSLTITTFREESILRPSSISVTSDDKVVVGARDEKRSVQVLSCEGKELLRFSAAKEFGSGIQCAIFYDEKYFVSVDLHMIKVFDSRGEFLYNFGEHGRNPGEFYCPQGLAAGPDNVLYICDSKNKRIQVTTLKGDLITSIAMKEPSIRIAISRDGDLFVADGTNEIKVFKPDHDA